MKKDQYIPHEVSTRTCSQVINLIETEGCAGYGIYWALLEYLRVQENYIGDLQALSSLKRQLKIRQSKLDKVLYGYGLFVCDGKTFYSPKLIEVMKPFEDRRARIDAYKRNKENAKSLEINDKTTSSNDIASFEVKGKGEGKVKGKKRRRNFFSYILFLSDGRRRSSSLGTLHRRVAAGGTMEGTDGDADRTEAAVLLTVSPNSGKLQTSHPLVGQ